MEIAHHKKVLENPILYKYLIIYTKILMNNQSSIIKTSKKEAERIALLTSIVKAIETTNYETKLIK